MALKYKLDSLEGLDEVTQKLYKKVGDKFVLDTEGMDEGDLAGLKSQVETLLAETKKQKQALKEKDEAEKAERERARKAAEEAAAKSGDLEALRKSAEERVAQARAEVEAQYKPQVEKLNANVRRLLIDNVATQVASKIGLKGSEALLIPHIKSRLDVEERNGEYITVVKSEKGEASALTVVDLEKEFVGNTAFAPVIAGSGGSGSGAGGNTNKGGGAADAKTVKRSAFDAMSHADRMSFSKGGGKVVD